MWSRNLINGRALAQWGLLHQKTNRQTDNNCPDHDSANFFRSVPSSTIVLYSQQLVTVSCSELTDYILTHCLLWLILRLFFHLLLFFRIVSDILFTHTSHDSFCYHPSIYIHILWFILISVLQSVFGFHFIVLILMSSLHQYLIFITNSDSFLPSVFCSPTCPFSFNMWKKEQVIILFLVIVSHNCSRVSSRVERLELPSFSLKFRFGKGTALFEKAKKQIDL